jgi:FdhD protein
MSLSVSEDVTTTSVVRIEWEGGTLHTSDDRVAREEPLEIRLGAMPLAVVMRTPGHDEELAWGFVVTERVVDDLGDIASVRHCSRVESPEAEDNVIVVTPRAGAAIDVERLRRNMFASSSCGVCGKASIESVACRADKLAYDTRIDPKVLVSLPERLRAAQPGFAKSGGLHAAGLFTTQGELLVAREDVGRHNAVDKVVGWATLRKRSLAGHVLFVSGRVSFEIVQKAATAAIPVVAAVSAPTSLAVALSAELGVTLVGFVRGERLCIYSGKERLR